MENNNDKSIATVTHLSQFSQYIIPFGNFIVPIIIWSIKGKKSDYVNFHSKQAINFQLSIFMYSVIMAVIAIPIFLFSILKSIKISQLLGNENFYIENIDMVNLSGIAIVGIILGFLFLLLKVIEIFLVIYGAIKASNGEKWKYPLSINFIK